MFKRQGDYVISTVVDITLTYIYMKKKNWYKCYGF